MKPNDEKASQDHLTYSIRGRVIGGILMTGLLLAAVFGWAANAQLSGAVVVTGEVAVDRNLRVVQHPDGGIVDEILVDAGDMVKEGDALIRLDQAAASTERAILHGKIAEFSIRRSRLLAQRDLRESFVMPDGMDDLV